MEKRCLTCQKTIIGRSDKKYCSVDCKNALHAKKRQEKPDIFRETNGWLHRNHAILATIMGNSKKEMLDKNILTRANFKFEFMTGVYFNKEQKMYRLIYDYAWMDFSDQKVLIVRKQ
jgi:hypothetical protein